MVLELDQEATVLQLELLLLVVRLLLGLLALATALLVVLLVELSCERPCAVAVSDGVEVWTSCQGCLYM